MKDKHLKEKGTLPERLMMNDSRSARMSANGITEKTSPKSLKKNRTSQNKR
ncbi:hypothetical protein [Thiolapillus sp.]|uniref:hypothetical protein n=1 Tax=Thiolapillus sp. TaxID=2017437 RepID=UPI003AF5DB94